MIEEDIVE